MEHDCHLRWQKDHPALMQFLVSKVQRTGPYKQKIQSQQITSP